MRRGWVAYSINCCFRFKKERRANPLMKGVAVSDVMRAMIRLGWGDEEIYDVFVATGLPPEEVELLLERLREEFQDSGIQPLSTHVAREVSEVVKNLLAELEQKLAPKLDGISLRLELLKQKLANQAGCGRLK